MKVMVLQFLNGAAVETDSAEHRKQLGGKVQNWYLRHLFLSRGCEATTIGGDSSVSATHQHCCLLETFTVIWQRSQTRGDCLWLALPLQDQQYWYFTRFFISKSASHLFFFFIFCWATGALFNDHVFLYSICTLRQIYIFPLFLS